MKIDFPNVDNKHKHIYDVFLTHDNKLIAYSKKFNIILIYDINDRNEWFINLKSLYVDDGLARRTDEETFQKLFHLYVAETLKEKFKNE